MSNQQFAEPEWQDSQQHNIHTDPREPQAGNPPAVNVDPREKIQPQPTPKRRKSKLWLWILIALIVGALAGSGIDETFHTFQHRSIETHTYQVNSLPTLIIHDNTGSITIHRGDDNSHITITTTKYAPVYSNTPTVEFFQNGNTITANERGGGFLGFSNADFEVTVPSNTNLQIHSDTG